MGVGCVAQSKLIVLYESLGILHVDGKRRNGKDVVLLLSSLVNESRGLSEHQ